MDSSVLKNVSMFSVLNEKELSKIYSFSTPKTLAKGEMVFFETEPYLGFYVVVEGCIKIFKIKGDGREQIIHFVHPYGTFAEVPMFEQYEKILNDQFTYPANAMATENDTRVLLIRSSLFYELLRKNHEISVKMLGALSKRLRHLNNYIETRMKDIPHRLAEFLVQECRRSGGNDIHKVEIEITKHDLASYLGTIDETLSRTFKRFQDEGLIQMKGKHVVINDIKKLIRIAEE